MEWNGERNGTMIWYTISVKSCYWFCSMHKLYKQVQHCPHASISKCSTVASWFSVVFESQTCTQKAKVWLHKTIVMEWEKMQWHRSGSFFYQKNTCEVPDKGVVVQLDMFLSKQVVVTGDGEILRWSMFLEPLHFWESLRWLQATLLGWRGLSLWLVLFLKNVFSVTEVN